MAQSSFTGEQLVSLASDFSALAEQAGEMLADPNLNPSVEQTNALYDSQNKLSDIAANLAMWGAKVEFDDSEASFASLSNATQSANAAVKKLKQRSRKSTRSSIFSVAPLRWASPSRPAMRWAS